MSNEAYDRAVDDAIDAAVEEAEALGITDEAQINRMVEQYLADELEKWE
jgi:methionine synthase II (cobalamin-independent)